MLPDKVYEALRWLVAVFMPALGVFFSALESAYRSYTYDLVGSRALFRRYFWYF